MHEEARERAGRDEGADFTPGEAEAGQVEAEKRHDARVTEVVVDVDKLDDGDHLDRQSMRIT